MEDLKDTFEKVLKASRGLGLVKGQIINELLLDLADEAENQSEEILKENKKDLDRMDESDPKYDRLKLTKQRIKDIANDLRNVSKLESPLGLIIDERSLNNGLHLQKVRVPLGVIGIIYEARPNVTFDVFSLCIKTGNACILKGGSDAEFSNKAIVALIKNVLKKHNISHEVLELLPPEREAATAMMQAVGYIDVIIPRGSQALINHVRDNAKVPVIETGAGIVHTYVDESADLGKASKIIENAKTRRVSVCNALDCLVLHSKLLPKLPELVAGLAQKNVIIYADQKAYGALKGNYPETLLKEATTGHFGTEFLDYKLSIKTVGSLNEALDHIALYSSKHSEAIVASDEQAITTFLRSVDAAAVYANASTAFTDGGQFGMGAEIGISTQKLHARGPMALEEITSYKWIINGSGHIRVP